MYYNLILFANLAFYKQQSIYIACKVKLVALKSEISKSHFDYFFVLRSYVCIYIEFYEDI